MNRKNRYGVTTTTECFFCDNTATTKNKEGLETCKNCENKGSAEILCPVHKEPMEVKNGRYGTYFYCWACNKNWSKFYLKKWKNLKR